MRHDRSDSHTNVSRIFNPDNDLALGNGDENYLPPQSARQMAYDLAFLPVWYAEAGDAVILPDSDALYYWSKTSTNSIQHPDIDFIVGSQAIPKQPILPWGWNRALIKQLTLRGVSAEWMPDAEKMGWWRNLSHRKTASEVLYELIERLGKENGFCGESHVCHTEEEIAARIDECRQTICKAPWSGSGKGLRRGQAPYAPPFSGWCKRLLSQQGSIIVEPYYNKVKDFAMEFYAPKHDEPVHFIGYSYFATDSNGAYKSNLLMADDEIEDALARYVGRESLMLLRHALTEVLTEKFAPTYTGHLGVDMMICQNTHNEAEESQLFYTIHPCVEINLRMNMGVVSHYLYERYVAPGSRGYFFVDYYPSTEQLNKQHISRLETHPCLFSADGKLIRGYQPLTPIGRKTQYLAGMMIVNDSHNP